MKHRFSLFIFISVMVTFLCISCDRSEIQKSSLGDDGKIKMRVDDCANCPSTSDCCCSLSIEETENGTFSICGPDEGDAASCSDNTGCNSNTINGFSHSSFMLSGSNLIELFCMIPNTGFRIGRSGGTGPVHLSVTCQHGQTSPQTLHFTWSGNDKEYFDVNGSCVLTACHP